MKKKSKAVVVTTEHRGVFFGYVDPEEDLTKKIIHITGARMCISWSAMRGMLGLASEGPGDMCRVSPKVSGVTLQGVTAVFEASAEAEEKWEAAPWKA